MSMLKFRVIVFSFIFIFGTIQSVYAHGLGSVESEIQFQ